MCVCHIDTISILSFNNNLQRYNCIDSYLENKVKFRTNLFVENLIFDEPQLFFYDLYSYVKANVL